MDFSLKSFRNTWSKTPNSHKPSTETFYQASVDDAKPKSKPSLREKYKSLKHENAKLVSILYSKNSQSKTLEAQLRNLEKEFMKYKTSCEEILDKFGPSQSLAEEADQLSKAVAGTPAAGMFKKLGGHKIKEYVSSSQLKKALKVSLGINKELLVNEDEPRKPTEEADDSLIRESEDLLKSINRQSLKISKIIQSSESSPPTNHK